MLAQRDADLTTMQVTVVDAASGEERVVAGLSAWETSPRWLPDGSGLLVASDRDGWFQVVRVPLVGGDRPALTSGAAEHGDYNGGFGLAPLPSPDGSRFVHPLLRDGLVDLVVAPLAAATPARRGPGRPPKHRSEALPGVRINPIDGVWRAVDWLPDGSGILAIGASERDPEDFWILPVPAPDGARARPRRLTRSLPAVVPVGGFVEPERLVIRARDGLPIPVTLWRPTAATGKRGGRSVPTIVNAHGGPSGQVFRDFQPFRQLLVQEGFAFLSVDFRGSTGHGRDFRLANRGEWGHARPARRHRRGALGGRPAVVGREARDVRRLVRRVSHPRARWSRSPRCGPPAWTCSAIRRSPRATATATGSAGSTSSG